jgi:hypothetical protein
MRRLAVECLALAFLLVLSSSTIATARQVCLPGTGLHCDGGGGSYDPGPEISSRNQRIAAGMNAAGALVNLLGTLLDIVDKTQGSGGGNQYDQEDEDRAVIRRLEQGERVEACRMARAWEASGIRQLRLSDDTSAEAHFAAALQYARNGHCDDLLEDYERNLNLAKAQGYMLSAVAMIGAKQYKEAENQLYAATNFAFAAREKDLENRIRAYRLQLHDKIDKGRPFKERVTCIEVNGQLECD